jgi:uncharacterized membrane protein
MAKLQIGIIKGFRMTKAGIPIVLALFALSTESAMADTLTSATLSGDCRYVTITAIAINLTRGAIYQVKYSVVQSGAPASQQPVGTINFTADAASQTVNQSGNWNPPLTSDVTLHDGTATLISSGSTIQIPPLTLNCGAPPSPKLGVVAQAIHVLALVVWIGGVWFVTTVLWPAMRQKPPEEWMREFRAIEHSFTPQAWMAMLLVLFSGLYMLNQYNLWQHLTDRHYWWIPFMVVVWLLLLVDQLIIRRTLYNRAMAAPHRELIRMLLMHRLILAFSLLAIFAAIGGSHGLF